MKATMSYNTSVTLELDEQDKKQQKHTKVTLNFKI